MSLHSPISRIPRSGRPEDQPGHKRTISAPSKLEQMQINLQARIEKEKFAKLAKQKEERMINLYKEEQERNNRQISKYGYNNNKTQTAAAATNVGGVRQFFQGRRAPDGGSAGKGVRGKPPLPYQKNSAGRDRGNPLAPISYRSPNESHDVGVLGGSGSPTGIRHSPKPFPNKSKLARPQQITRGYNTPNDSGNESSGYEDQNRFNNRAKNTKLMQKRQQYFNQQQASSEEDVNSPVKKQSSFQQWKQERNNNIPPADKTYTVKKTKGVQKSRLPPPRSTALHNGYHSDGPASDFQKWQMDQNKERDERLRKHQEKNRPEQDSPSSSPALYNQDNLSSVRRQQFKKKLQRRGSQPSTGRTQVDYESSNGEEEENYAPQSNRSNASKVSAAVMDRNAQLESELKRKERELLEMIEKQQRELEGMKEQRAREEAEHDKEWLEGFVKNQKQQAEEEREEKRKAEEQEKRRKLREAEEREYQKSRRSNFSEEHVPSPPPTSKPANTRPMPRKPAMVKRAKPAPVRKPPPPPAEDGSEEPFFDTSNAADFYSNLAVTDPDAAPVNLNLVPCGLCGRKFAAERIPKHQVACEKAQAAAAKRKKFDPVKMRAEGTELAQYASHPNKPEPKKKDTGDWRKKREDFIKALRYAKKVTEIEKKGGNVADLPPPPRTENAHYKQCPYCERRFAPDTAERHIPKCKDIKARPKPAANKRRGR